MKPLDWFIKVSGLLVSLAVCGGLCLAQIKVNEGKAKPEPRPRTNRAKPAITRRPRSSEVTTNPPKGTQPAEPIDPVADDRKLGLESFKKEEWESAITSLKKVLTVHPRDAEVLYTLGDSYSHLKQFPDAISSYKQAITLDEKSADGPTYFNLGLAYESTKDYPNARDAFKKASEKADTVAEQAEALTHLGDVSSKLNDWNHAIDAYERASIFDPKIEDPDVFFNWGLAYVNSSGQYEKAVPLFQKAIDLKVENLAEAYFKLGRALYIVKRFSEAEDSFKKQLEKKNDDDNAGDAYLILGDMYFHELLNREAALDAFLGAVRIHSKDHLAWSNLGVAQSNLLKFEDAAKSYNQAIALDPNDPHYRVGLGRALWYLHRYNEAIDACNKALERPPRLSEAYYYRGLSYNSLNQFDQAADSLNKGIEIGFDKRSSEANAHYNLAVSHSKLGNVAAAKQQCDFLRTMGSAAPADTLGVCR